jgi:hypothetical protein
MPDALVDIIRSGSGTGLGGVTTDDIVPVLGLEIPDCAGEETGGDEVEETC